MVMKVVPEVYDQLPDNPVEMLLIAFGSQESIAAFCAVTPQAVWNWNRDRYGLNLCLSCGPWRNQLKGM